MPRPDNWPVTLQQVIEARIEIDRRRGLEIDRAIERIRAEGRLEIEELQAACAEVGHLWAPCISTSTGLHGVLCCACGAPKVDPAAIATEASSARLQ